jgi:hypothetical protein
MSFLDCQDAELDSRVHRVCAPLFATDQFLAQGHDASTTGATLTFVKFEGRIYGVTCHHVLAAFYAIAIREQRRIIPTIHSGPCIQAIGEPTAHGGYRWGFQSCREFLTPAQIDDSEASDALDRKNADRPDIAIAELTAMWPLLQQFRAAEPIDLNAWTEPNWSAAQPVFMAFGFPTAHKYRVDDKVAAPMPRVGATLASEAPSADRPRFTLCSTLEAAHGWGLSGLSGGPVVMAHAARDRYTFVGITYEGSPIAKDPKQTEDSILRAEDLLLKAYYLSPDCFRDWLMERRYGIELPAEWTTVDRTHDETGSAPDSP